MSEVLSQNEIDELLTALNTGEVDVKEIEEEQNEKKVRKYDFKRPDKFAKEQLRTLENIHDNYSRLLNNFLSGYLRTFTEVEVLSTQSLIFNEFSNSVSNPAILGIVKLEPLEGEIIIELSSDIVFKIIERVLGGSEKDSSEAVSRTLTEIEISLLKSFLKKFLKFMKDSWESIIELNPKLIEIETNSQFAQIASPTESIALVTLNIKINNSEGMMNICLPHKVIEPILPNLSSKMWFSDISKKPITEEQKGLVIKQLAKTNLAVKAVIGGTNISVKELLNVRRGDVLVLDRKADQEIDIYVDDELKFKGIPGKNKNKVAVKIKGIYQKGDAYNG
ncbi:flagellar motor switch protein FliM [Clostridiaceae bacterium HSG29]|nr:flagellar motor switch protein FliM [Clostridiaceae bacterium HSG29]